MLPFQVFQLFMIYRRDVEVEYGFRGTSAMLDQCLSREALEALAQIPCSGEAWGAGESVTSRLVHLTDVRPSGGRKRVFMSEVESFHVEASLNKINPRKRNISGRCLWIPNGEMMNVHTHRSMI